MRGEFARELETTVRTERNKLGRSGRDDEGNKECGAADLKSDPPAFFTSRSCRCRGQARRHVFPRQ